MQLVNPAFIPRNHRIEQAIRAAEDHNDFSLFEKLHTVLRQPFADQPQAREYQKPPRPEEVVQATFCGT
jgi:uncharacterized protein YdiU (UPF0061 family)